MADEHQFIHDGLQRTQIDEFFERELSRAGYGGMEVAKTPMGTQIVLKAEKPGMVIGKGGKNIRKITAELEEQFDLDDPQIDVQEVDEPDLNAQIVADRLANALERGWYFRKAGHTTIDRIMDAGALGAEIVLSGKVTGARSRVEKFNRGYIKHNGEPAEDIVDEGIGVSVMKLGTIGVQVKIIPPGADLPDDFQVYEGADVEEHIEEPEEGVEGLLADVEGEEPADGEVAEPVADEDVAEEIVDEAVEAEEGAAETSPPEAAESPDAAEADIDAVDAAIEAEVEDEDESDGEEGEPSEAAEAEAAELVEEMEAADEAAAEDETDVDEATDDEPAEDATDEDAEAEADAGSEADDDADEEVAE